MLNIIEACVTVGHLKTRNFHHFWPNKIRNSTYVTISFKFLFYGFVKQILKKILCMTRNKNHY